MGEKEVEPHHEEHHNSEHHTHHAHKPASKISSLKHKMADLFKEIVVAPPEEKAEELVETPEREFVEHGIRVTAETDDSPVKEVEAVKVEEVEELDEDDLRNQEREKTREMIHEHIVGKLNSAVAQWKETGDVGMKLEPPVPLREKVKSMWSHMMEKSAPLAAKLKHEIEQVADKVAARLKKAEQKGEKLNPDIVVKDEWSQVLKKLDSMAGPSERDEIEKIYKQLGGQ